MRLKRISENTVVVIHIELFLRDFFFFGIFLPYRRNRILDKKFVAAHVVFDAETVGEIKIWRSDSVQKLFQYYRKFGENLKKNGKIIKFKIAVT